MNRLIPLLLAGLLALSGCGGGTTANVESKCSSSGRRGTCTVTIVNLDETIYRHEINDSDFWPGANGVEVDMRISVEKGTILVWFNDPALNKVAVMVEPGQTVEISDTAWLDTLGDKRAFSVYFEPLGEAKHAENVWAEIRYDMP